jgi:undecaprenyl diphosphate synthase
MNDEVGAQSLFSRPAKPPRDHEPRFHVAIIPDGNGRWAATRGLPRSAGHEAGVEAVRRVVAAAPGLGIDLLTFYTFSADNWERPANEVRGLLEVLARFLRDEAERYAREGVRLSVIGRRDRLAPELRAAMAAAERATTAGRRLHLRLAVDYSAQESILRAACRMISSLEISAQEFSRLLGLVGFDDGPSPEVDLLIRSGGEQRLSDFLLWESVYAELVFTPRLWPDFAANDLAAAVEEFHRRDRRFGRVPEAAAG